ncbi:MAG TPA: L-threonine 3-dehydrogenase [Chloroflexi bacterium]|nr:L-threonine 3-dehydrogenase [Chloroflexota bacterium]HCU98211.1 L-threonine 3-dehydrogenase [Chloroflexota bacterium]|tara:strand:- start:5911 stop:6942 length:1032 start_codon:yes stop_codon:yes gene_type:complete
MKALVKTRPQIGLELKEVPTPEPGPDEVRIHIMKSSICGTDLHIYDWDNWASHNINPPLTIGHEYVGTIDKVGSNVHDYSPGDLVSGEGHIVCGLCRNCLAGRRHLCRDTLGVGINRPGSFAEYLIIPVANVWPCDSKIPLELLTCFDPLGNATHASLSFNVIGEDVLITGAGPIGLMAASIVRHIGARHVVITDPNPYRVELAKNMGVSVAINPMEQTLKDTMNYLGMKEGFDVGLEMSGNPDALQSIVENMSHGGKVALLGLLPDTTTTAWNKVIFHGLTIKGIYGREMFETWYKMTTMLQSGLDISKVVTHQMNYKDYADGFDLMRSGQCGKVILDWEKI